ncbi:MAG: signal recognition particle-docking protein FtsY [Rickettsiales bacterium]|jgi:fused signal recognition particle receptor|nr:signal recognition particle-docking protein FtsY [Rickettsiales bacterium]
MLFKNKGMLSVFTGRKIDDSILEELEDTLVMSDVSVSIANSIVNSIKNSKLPKDATINDAKHIIFEKLDNIIRCGGKKIEFLEKPSVMLFMGVNGSGKTTVIGKIANKFVKNGKKVLLAAGDTFRAGASEQLQVWAKTTGSGFIEKQKDTEEPATLACRAYAKAKEENYDFLLIDTAGRLQNNINLMEELKKVSRVLKKMDKNAPHQTILTLDANVGQNSLKQFESFREAIEIDSIIINKLDGTAKGGVIVSILEQFKKPIFAVGVGEGVNDIEDFNSKNFLNNLLGTEYER